MAEKKLSHMDESGRPRMVDIGGKGDTVRRAVVKGVVRMQPATFQMIKQGGTAKGDVLSVAQLAGTMAAKRTPDLIPLCHPILLENIDIEFSPDEKTGTIEITTTVKSSGKTGVEMEAMTIYDMCKAVDRGMKIDNIRLVKKSGGKSGQIELE